MRASYPELLRRFAIILGGLFAVCLFYRETILSGFDLLPGDRGDSRLNIFIFEHWWRVFQGKAYWLDLGYFYPTEHTLGYTHALFLNAVVYSIFRLIGLDMFGAFITSLFALSALGYGGMYLLLRRIFSVPFGIAIAVSILFICSSSFYISFAISHPQYVTIVYLPWILLGVGSYLKNPDKLARIGWWQGVGSTLLLALLFYTSFYTGWFFMFWLCLFGFWGLVFAWLRWGLVDTLKRADQLLARYFKQWVGFGFTFAVALVPFLITYLPIIQLNGSRHFHNEVLHSLPLRFDFINTGHENLIWGDFLQMINPAMNERMNYHEMWYGFPIISFCIYFVCFLIAVFSVRALIHKQVCSGVISNFENYIVFSLSLFAAATFVALIANFEIFHLWKVIYKYVPGSSALRVISRSLLILGIPLLICLALVLSEVWARSRKLNSVSRKNLVQTGMVLLPVIMLVESLSTIWFARYSAGDERAFMASISPPPPGTDSFFVVKSRPDEISDSFAQIDAMLIAQKYDIATYNGHSGLAPEGWAFYGVEDEDFLYRVCKWFTDREETGNKVTLDLSTGEWSTVDCSQHQEPPYHLHQPLPNGTPSGLEK